MKYIPANSNHFGRALLISLLGMLILFSSCALRKGLESQSELPFKKDINVNKATLQQGGTCSVSDAQFSPVLLKEVQCSEGAFIQSVQLFDFVVPHQSKQPLSLSGSKAPPPKYPHYLFHQQLKIDC